MSEKDFEVGEILIFQHATNDLSRNNKECELIGGWMLRQTGVVDHASHRINTVEEECYQIKFQDGAIMNCQKHQLRRKKPPTNNDSNTITSWDDCGWNPHKIKEIV